MATLNSSFGTASRYLPETLAPDWPGGFWLHFLVFAVVIIALVLVMVMVFIYLERRGIGRFQIRPGPNRCGPFGVLQPIADAIKVLMKEDIVPTKADPWVHWLAPVVTFVPALMVFAVIPIHDGAILADLNVGVLYILAIGSISVVGMFMAGWGSSNKYSLISAMRAVAQMVSYELPIVLSIVGVVLLTGSLSMNDIVAEQSIPFFLLMPLGFFIYFAAASAEINRAPFDLLEAESEIVAGYHTEYSGMKFTLFYLAEYGHAFAMAAIVTTLFLSGWKGPLLPPILWFLVKTLLVFFVLLWTRSTLPRLRVDQLMGFAWKFLFPMALINIVIIATEVMIWREGLPWPLILVNFALAGVLILLWSKFSTLGGGRVEV